MRSITTLILVLATIFAFGCSKKVPQDPYQEQQRKVLMNKGRLVQDLARPANVHAAKIESATLVRGLRGTGADEPPSSYQQLVLTDLSRDVEKKRTAKSEIASLNTAIALLETVVPPGAQKGDRLDATITLPSNSEATSIQNGYVEDADMYQYMTADIVRRGYVLGVANGYVTLDPNLVENNSPIAYKKGKIIGGTVVTRPRPIWLEIKEDERSAGVAQRIEDVINKRFSYKKPGYADKKKVAEAKAGAARINLEVPEEYRDNVIRYVNVVLAISFYETADELNERVDRLAQQLLIPESSEFASLQLEAIGSTNAKVVDAIRRGMDSTNDAVRFNSAITSAYFNIRQDRQKTARILAEFARTNATYRPAALATLGVAMKTSFDVDSELRKLLSEQNIETRYGAFRALWTRNPSDYMIQGENMADQFGYHCLNCGGASYVHVSQSTRPEIVLFNYEDGIVVKQYAAGDGVDEQRRVSYKVDDVIRAIVELGGTYPDVVSFLTQAKIKKYLYASDDAGQMAECPLAIDALPGAKAASFKRVRDVEAIVKREEAREKAERKARKEPSIWSSWFKKKEDSGEFNLEEFDAVNGGDLEPASGTFDGETTAEPADDAARAEEFSLDENEEE